MITDEKIIIKSIVYTMVKNGVDGKFLLNGNEHRDESFIEGSDKELLQHVFDSLEEILEITKNVQSKLIKSQVVREAFPDKVKAGLLDYETMRDYSLNSMY